MMRSVGVFARALFKSSLSISRAEELARDIAAVAAATSSSYDYTKTLWKPENVSFLAWPSDPTRLPTVLPAERNFSTLRL